MVHPPITGIITNLNNGWQEDILFADFDFKIAFSAKKKS